jgi:predicted RNase H-like HicB family nuclease
MILDVTAHVYRDGKWFVAFCPEFPEANGQGETREECLQSLKDAIHLLVEDRRLDSQNLIPKNAETVALA